LLRQSDAQTAEGRHLWIGRLKVVDAPEGIAFEVPGNPWRIIVLLALITIELTHLQNDPRFLLLLVPLSLIAVFLRDRHKTVITITPAHLTIRREWFGLHWTRHFDTQKVHHLRFETNSNFRSIPRYPQQSFFSSYGTGGWLAFDHDPLARHFASGIQEEEATAIRKLIRKRFPLMTRHAQPEESYPMPTTEWPDSDEQGDSTLK
jgi:hypothetical protein